ncbi:hypothetical protein BU23DRAFT_212513 [Bimuria novae-zelandiae CBS 107.79]|uniref:Uncharacterized protein n=1 Tax=Bimuria novae-zelandiae CBS 107.79 TaxID=1447943 RepID=A0A6A5V079_9PLEO|nr:hypothetical protein BU23DRAFT_212513 [Bimuria novae-zelandiae CBS 107.79]
MGSRDRATTTKQPILSYFSLSVCPKGHNSDRKALQIPLKSSVRSDAQQSPESVIHVTAIDAPRHARRSPLLFWHRRQERLLSFLRAHSTSTAPSLPALSCTFLLVYGVLLLRASHCADVPSDLRRRLLAPSGRFDERAISLPGHFLPSTSLNTVSDTLLHLHHHLPRL